MRTLSIPLVEGIAMPVTNLTKKTWLATKVRKADSFFTRLVGLLKRNKLGPEEALWLMPEQGDSHDRNEASHRRRFSGQR